MSLIHRLRLLPLAGFILVLGVLSLGDRAPAASRARLTTVRKIGNRIENRFHVDYVDRSDVPFAFDKVGHFSLYFVAGVLAWLGFQNRVRPWVVAAGVVGFSALIEVAQPLLSYSRSAQLSDLVANASGALLGVGLAFLATRVVGSIARRIPSLRH